jgi:hypothetical protein
LSLLSFKTTKEIYKYVKNIQQRINLFVLFLSIESKFSIAVSRKEPSKNPKMSSQNNNERQQQVCQFSVSSLVMLCILLTASQLLQSSTAFSTLSMQQRTHNNGLTSRLHAASAGNPDDEITRQVERAKELLAKTKAKMEAQEQADANGPTGAAANVPFFASKDNKSNSKKEKLMKTQNEEGLFTTDGGLMAQMSESEDWEVRPLNEVFQNEKEITRKTNKLANRDMSAGIQGLQRVLQTEDYLKIFDKRNRFIGEN